MSLLNRWSLDGLLLAALLAAGAHATAEPITWRLGGVRLDDGGRLQGVLTFDWPAEENVVVPLDAFLITASGGDEATFPAATYEPASVSVAIFARNPGNPALPPLGQFLFFLDAPTPFGRPRSLRIAPTAALDGTLTTVPLLTVTDLPLPGGQGREECFNCVPFRTITAGSLIPEPGTLGLVCAALAGGALVGLGRSKSAPSAALHTSR